MQVELRYETDDSFELGVVLDESETSAEVEHAALTVAYKKKIEPTKKLRPAEAVRAELGEEEAAFLFDEEVMRHSASFALTQVERDTVGAPQFACSEHVEEQKPFAFRMTCVKVPVIELSSYEAPVVNMPALTVTDGEVQEQIDAMARASAEQVQDEDADAVTRGDTVQIAMSTTKDGETVRPLTASRRMYRTGTFSMPDAFDEAICGMKVGEEKTFTFEGPSLECDAEGNPLMEEFVTTVTVLGVLRDEEPERDDTWARRVMPGCASLDDMRERIRARLLSQRQKEYQSQVEQLACAELAKRVDDSLPDAVYGAVVEEAKRQMVDQLAEQGMTFEQYKEEQNIDEQKMAMGLMMQARTQLFQQLALDAYARREGLVLEEDDLDAFFETIAPGKAAQAKADFEGDGRLFAARGAALRLKARVHVGSKAVVRPLTEGAAE